MQKYFIDAWRDIAALQMLPLKVKNMQKNSTTTNNNNNENYIVVYKYVVFVGAKDFSWDVSIIKIELNWIYMVPIYNSSLLQLNFFFFTIKCYCIHYHML